MPYVDTLRQRAKKNLSLSVVTSFGVQYVLQQFLYMTEKAQSLLDENTYVFAVHAHANKNDVKYAIKTMYDIEPLSVRIVRVPKKSRMQKGTVRKTFKKAYIRLPQGKQLSFDVV